MASGANNDYLVFLKLQKRMAKHERDIENLLTDSQNGKIPQRREINAAAAKLREQFKDLKKRFCEFFNQFSLCRSGIHTLDDSAIEKLLSELGENDLEIFHRGIQLYLDELDEIGRRFVSIFLDLEESQYDEPIPAEEPRVSVNFAQLLEILERIKEGEDNLRKSTELLASYRGESLNLQEVKEEVEMSSTGLEDFKRKFQAFQKEFFPSGDRILDPSLQKIFLQKIDEFSDEFAAVDEYVKYALAEVEANGLGVFDLKESQKLQLPPLKQQQEPNLRLPLETESGTVHNMILSGILIDMYGFRYAEARHLAQVFPSVSYLQPFVGASDTLVAAKEDFQKYKSDYQIFQHHIPDALRNWIVPFEAKVCNFVSRIFNMLSGNEAASKQLQQWRTTLEQLSESNDGMVPVSVHFIITALLGMQPLEENPGLNIDQKAKPGLHTGLEEMIDSVHEIVLHLRFVLKVSSITNAATMSPNVLDTCELVLRQCEEELEMLEWRMEQGKRKVGENMKRVDEPIGSCSTGGEGVLENVDRNQDKSEKARGKRQKFA